MLRDKELQLYSHVFYTILLTREAYYFPKADADSSKPDSLIVYTAQAVCNQICLEPCLQLIIWNSGMLALFHLS